MASQVNDALAGPLPVAINKMRAYLPNPTTHAILFKPVKSNIAEAHGQVRARTNTLLYQVRCTHKHMQGPRQPSGQVHARANTLAHHAHCTHTVHTWKVTTSRKVDTSRKPAYQ